MSAPRLPLLALLGPGLLTAATGVGAGDLATGGFAGSKLGVAILWAVAVGALLKYVVTEGLARWQLVTGETILEGVMGRVGPWGLLFLVYLLPWSFFVGAALISACGVTAHALAPGLIDDPATARLVLGAAHAAVAASLVWLGGFRFFERVMAACIGVMFAAVITTAIAMRPDPGAIAAGLLVPRIPDALDGGLTWTIALVGGVGGTLTVVCYGYWIREAGRTTPRAIRTCRIDLAVGYAATALFGMAMIVIASGLTLDGGGAGLIVALADRLESAVGAAGRAVRLIFLVGAWAAVFSSLLGVLQSVPYVFADLLRTTLGGDGGRRSLAERPVDTRGVPYRAYLLALAFVPLVQVSHPFREVQKYYAVMGAAFVPLLALALLVMTTRPRLGAHRSRWWTVAVLALTVILAVVAGYVELR